MSEVSRFEQLVDVAKSHVKQMPPHEALRQRRAGAVLIGVREAADFQTIHAVGAIHLSRGVLEFKIEDTVPDPSTPIICYCGGGSRSALAADSLQKMGYTNVVSMETGFRGWKQAELPTHQSTSNS